MLTLQDIHVINSNGCYTFDAVPNASMLDARNPRLRNTSVETVFEELVQLHGNAGKQNVLLLEGGEDIHPSLYGQENIYSYGVGAEPSRRDKHEIALLKLAKKYDVPVFGICRGHQLMAAVQGGSLYQDLSMIETTMNHHKAHQVPLVLYKELHKHRPKSWLSNSMHHQAVDQMPEDGVLIAETVDGVNEGIRYTSFRGISYQFHPEFAGDLDLLMWSVNLLMGNIKPKE